MCKITVMPIQAGCAGEVDNERLQPDVNRMLIGRKPHFSSRFRTIGVLL